MSRKLVAQFALTLLLSGIALLGNAAITTQLSSSGQFLVVKNTSNSWTWDNAQQYATNTYGAHLASIHSSNESSEIASAVDELGGTLFFDDAWVGGFYNSGSWGWSDGTSWDYDNWALFEPDDFGAVYINDLGDWHDDISSATLEMLVIDLTSPVPIPAAAWLFGSALFGLAMVKRKRA